MRGTLTTAIQRRRTLASWGAGFFALFWTVGVVRLPEEYEAPMSLSFEVAGCPGATELSLANTLAAYRLARPQAIAEGVSQRRLTKLMELHELDWPKLEGASARDLVRIMRSRIAIESEAVYEEQEGGRLKPVTKIERISYRGASPDEALAVASSLRDYFLADLLKIQRDVDVEALTRLRLELRSLEERLAEPERVAGAGEPEAVMTPTTGAAGGPVDAWGKRERAQARLRCLQDQLAVSEAPWERYREVALRGVEIFEPPKEARNVSWARHLGWLGLGLVLSLIAGIAVAVALEVLESRRH